MKLFLTLFSISFLYLLSFSQMETPVVKPDHVIIIQTAREVSNKAVIGHFIKGVVVADDREDTTLLGYYTSNIFGKKTNRLRFGSACNIEIAHWLANYLRIDSNKSDNEILYVSIKKFILSAEVTEKVFDNGHQGQAQNGWDEGVLAKMEFYFMKEAVYYPLYRFDSILVINDKLKENAGEFVTTALKAGIDKLFTIDIEAVLMKARKLTLLDITAHNNNRNVPILIQTDYKKGVYKTFEEFKNNNPSIKNFQFKKGNAGDILYVTENGQEYPERNAWGFCDGKNFFINSADKYAQLINEGQTFYFKGIKSVTRSAMHRTMKTSMFNLATNTGEKKTAYSLDYKYYIIDMETGEAY
jgi:hypothetical protein